MSRSYLLMSADIRWAEQARSDGVPAVMALLTGPYKESLEYLFTMSLWMDLGDFVAGYRTVVERFAKLKGPARRRQLPIALEVVETELSTLRERRLLKLSDEPVTRLANRVLHQAWHPTRDDALALEIHWREQDGRHIVDFGPEDVRGELLALLEETLSQVGRFTGLLACGHVEPGDASPLTAYHSSLSRR